MKYKEPRAMKEIHDIRLALYNEKKRLSSQEKVLLANKTARKLIKNYELGIELLPNPKEACSQPL